MKNRTEEIKKELIKKYKHTFKEAKWKVEHRSDGYSFLGFPYQYEGKEKFGWLGPVDPIMANWLISAIEEKQKLV